MSAPLDTPASLDTSERYPLLFGPSPVHPLERLTHHLGGATLWAKREDCNSGIAYGGHILISRLAGADVRLVRVGIGVKESGERAVREVEEAGGRPYAIPASCSEHRLDGLGCANWAYELAAQEAESGVFFDTVVVCSVTGSTQAGMVAGFAALAEEGARPRRVLGIDTSAAPDRTREQITRIARGTAGLIGVQKDLTEADVELDERYHAGTYGVSDERTLAAMRLAAGTEGMITDPVYEGKSMAGTVDPVGRGEIPRDATVLYAHLGGQPALNAYSALFRGCAGRSFELFVCLFHTDVRAV
ncbi:pyridoxal-phosphate dependent enzyme [Streptomyces arenae]|nr:pyridoxal-phosphate dependent enzyme [Streptomyces arenae]